MIPVAYRAILQVVVYAAMAGVVLFAGWRLYANYQDGQQAKAELLEARNKEQTTVDIIGDVDAGVAENAKVEVVVTDSRTAYNRGYQDAKRSNPEIADLAATPIPAELRQLARERRAARERSGSVEARSRDDAPNPGPSR